MWFRYLKNSCTALQSNISFLENGGTKAFYSWITVKNINFTRDSIDTYKYVTRLKTSQNEMHAVMTIFAIWLKYKVKIYNSILYRLVQKIPHGS